MRVGQTIQLLIFRNQRETIRHLREPVLLLLAVACAGCEPRPLQEAQRSPRTLVAHVVTVAGGRDLEAFHAAVTPEVRDRYPDREALEELVSRISSRIDSGQFRRGENSMGSSGPDPLGPPRVEGHREVRVYGYAAHQNLRDGAGAVIGRTELLEAEIRCEKRLKGPESAQVCRVSRIE